MINVATATIAIVIRNVFIVYLQILIQLAPDTDASVSNWARASSQVLHFFTQISVMGTSSEGGCYICFEGQVRVTA